jgi:hypothetical protein
VRAVRRRTAADSRCDSDDRRVDPRAVLLVRDVSANVAFMNWVPAVFSLLGVVVGASGSFLAVYYAQRTTREQARLQHEAAMRNELKEVLLEYLSVVEDSWAFLDGLWGKQPLVSKAGERLSDEAVDQEAARRNHDVWLYQQKLNLVASSAVRQSALKLTGHLYEATFHRERIETGLWQYLAPAQEQFLAAAREDLGVAAATLGPDASGQVR